MSLSSFIWIICWYSHQSVALVTSIHSTLITSLHLRLSRRAESISEELGKTTDAITATNTTGIVGGFHRKRLEWTLQYVYRTVKDWRLLYISRPWLMPFKQNWGSRTSSKCRSQLPRSSASAAFGSSRWFEAAPAHCWTRSGLKHRLVKNGSMPKKETVDLYIISSGWLNFELVHICKQYHQL